MQLNVQCLSNKLNSLEVLLEEKHPDVLSVSEHWCKEDGVTSMVLPGYTLADYFCRSSREHGGSLLYTRNGLEVKRLKVSEFSVEMHVEICGIVVTVGDASFSVLSVYRPCTGCNKTKLLNELLDCFNLTKTSEVATRVYTNINGITSTSKVDYIISSSDLCNYKCTVFEPHISDHKAMLLKMSLKPISAPKTKISIRNVNQNNLNKLNACISDSNFVDLYSESDVDLCFESFNNEILYFLEVCCPVKHIFATNSRKNWITSEIRQSKQNLTNLYWLHSVVRSPSTLFKYKNAKLQHNSLINETKINYYSSKIDKSDNKNKTLWNIVNKFTCRKTRAHHPVSIILDGVKYDSPSVLVNIFASHFTSMAKSKLKSCYGDNLSISCTTASLVDNTFYFYPVTKLEVLDAIKNLKNKNCVGLHSISTKIVKSISETISEHFAHVVNLSLSTGKFPNTLRESIVIPIHKGGNLDEITNYRPISIISVLSKVFEGIGSVLGPLLFLLFINDLPIHLALFLVVLFADDTSVVVSAETAEELRNACEAIIRQFVAWCRSNRVIVNVNKTVCIHFGIKNNPVDTLEIYHSNFLIKSAIPEGDHSVNKQPKDLLYKE
ncbi:uncharacterized protein LOC123683137 [Harmonia axyridis]|uniref:uncharacterized protein LOC123683137 n=1 Tax=Harmonia axyridis TaxID=115357 RepID=UPI001E2786D1|nr:uncharacterized protein LOC123683137 [Harmonia axyridis]